MAGQLILWLTVVIGTFCRSGRGHRTKPSLRSLHSQGSGGSQSSDPTGWKWCHILTIYHHKMGILWHIILCIPGIEHRKCTCCFLKVAAKYKVEMTRRSYSDGHIIPGFTCPNFIETPRVPLNLQHSVICSSVARITLYREQLGWTCWSSTQILL